MKRLLLLTGCVWITSLSHAQVFWTETFGTGCNQGALASAFSGANGAWTVTNTGTNAAEANTWFVSAMENGNAAGQCGSGCGSDPSLHVGNVAVAVLGLPADNGAAYNSGGLCGTFFCVDTDKRVESPTINCTGQSNITLAFNYIENGQGTTDDATLWYFDGTTWAQIDPLAKPPLGACAPQGQWTAFSMTLPASANNNPNVKIGFRWVNNDDGVGTDPSFAVDDIELSVATTGPTASFTVNNSNLCTGDCVNFTNTSTGGPFTSISWTFNGGTPSTSNSPTPNVCYNTPGTYDVTLTVTDANGTDTDTQVGYITVTGCTAPTASFTASSTNLCENDCISFTNTSTGSPFTLVAWQFPGATPATSTNPAPTNICYAAAGSYDVILIVQNANGADTLTMPGYITVSNCSGPPTAAISVASTTICAGQCIDFTDASTGAPTAWSWSFPGATPASSNLQNPTSICYATAGNYTVTLDASNANGNDQTTINITVTNCVTPIAGFNTSTGSTSVCTNQCITFTNTSTGATTYNWSFPGGSPTSSTSANPGTICYTTVGNYTVTLIASGPGGADTTTLNLSVNSAPWVIVSPDVTIDQGDSTLIGAVGQDTVGTYVWVSLDSTDIIIGDTVWAGPLTSTCYVLYYDNGSPCRGLDTVCIEVIPQEVFDVPNAFSPNGDGINDILFVVGNEIYSIKFKIYNRYGQMVFSTDTPSLGWDGRHNGKEVDPGVFVWYAECIFVSGRIEAKKGNVTLIR